MCEGASDKRAEKPLRLPRERGGTTNERQSERQARTVCAEQTGDETQELLEEVLRRENLIAAHQRVKRNKGAPGVDGMSVDELMPYCREHWQEIREQLLNETYRPRPIRRVEIPKPDGHGVRILGIPVVLDRLIQQALLQVLNPIVDPTFSEHSYGYRPGRSAHGAVSRAREYVEAGHTWVADFDLASFFDRVNHDVLMARVARRIHDKRILHLIRRYLQAGMMEGGLASPRTKGTPQGSPLSPLLSNILLDELDRELESRGHCFCRYADDVNVYVSSEAAGHRVMASIEKFLLKRLRLRLNHEKSAVARPWERSFLGYSIARTEPPKLQISKKSMSKLKKKLKPLWKKGRGRSLKRTIEELNRTIPGWAAYYRLAEVAWPFKALDRWIRRRLRLIAWRHWKTPKTRMKKLRKLGVPRRIAETAAYAYCGPWRCSALPAVHQALSNDVLKQWGLKSLFQEHLGGACST